MPLDYDLVVIGSTAAAYYAAQQAAQLNARVALVTQWLQADDDSPNGCFIPQPQTGQTPSWQEGNELKSISSHKLSKLALLGVDVIHAQGQFYPQPRQKHRRTSAFLVNDRLLRARAYLLAPPATRIPMDVPGLQDIEYWTPTTLMRLSLKQVTEWTEWLKSKQKWLIVGHDFASLELVQWLRRYGNEVTLVTDLPRVLPDHELEIAHWVQGQLEAEGIHILTQTNLLQLKAQRQHQKIVTVQTQRPSLINLPVATVSDLVFDQLLLTGPQSLNLATLDLETLGIQARSMSQPWINDKLQTAHPQIYACGDFWQQRHHSIAAACYEVNIALKNALFFPLFRVTAQGYAQVPEILWTDPPAARVGLTENQARVQYHRNVLVVQQPLPTQGGRMGLGKLILHQDGRLLGAHFVGQAAPELSSIMSFALQNQLKLDRLANLYPSHSVSRWLQQVAQDSECQRHDRNVRRQNGLETFFYVRRTWF
jgi:pyruvate/2-oxoglutarate dehydrogenase complex dihydrolipoamide dehydrogenase (E3) component